VRRLTLALAAILVAACGSTAVTAKPSGSVASIAPTASVAASAPETIDPAAEGSVKPADISTWEMMAPVGLRFALAFPGPPTRSTGKVGDPPMATAFWTYTDPEGRKFQLARSVLAYGMLSDNPPALLDKLDDSLFEGLAGGAFTRRSTVSTDGRPGIEYGIRSGNIRSRGLLVLDDTILYRVSVTFDVDHVDEAAALGFMYSFTLMP
jgi:hypothetical protein